jgi:hypothetical protein
MNGGGAIPNPTLSPVPKSQHFQFKVIKGPTIEDDSPKEWISKR